MEQQTYYYPAISGIGAIEGERKVLSFAKNNGKIFIFEKKTKLKTTWDRIPLVRGIAFFFFGVINFFSFLFFSLKQTEDYAKPFLIEEKVANGLNTSKKPIFLTIIGILSFVLGFFAFSFLPTMIARAFPDNFSDFAKNLILAISKASIFYLFLLSLKIIPVMRAFYRFNGVLASNVLPQIKKAKQQNNNTNLPNFLTFFVFSFVFIFFVISLIGFKAMFVWRLLFNLAIINVSFMLLYEIFLLTVKHNLVFFKILFYIFNFVVTEKPSRAEQDVFDACKRELELKFEKEEFVIEPNSDKTALSVVLSFVEKSLAGNGINDKSEAEWLVATVLGKNRAELKLVRQVEDKDFLKIKEVLSRRIEKEPLSKIFGFADFYGEKFFVDKNVLSPRPETEEVVQEAIKIINRNGYNHVLDLCTGSGVIAITIAKNTKAKIVATDISKQALKVAEKNAKNLNTKISFYQSNMFEELKKKSVFDIIVSNPPYLETNEIIMLEDEVKKHDPIIALDGGEDGLDFYKQIAKEAPNHLVKDGKIVLEISFSKAKEIRKIFTENFDNISIKKDMYGNDRILIATKKEKKSARKN